MTSIKKAFFTLAIAAMPLTYSFAASSNAFLLEDSGQFNFTSEISATLDGQGFNKQDSDLNRPVES
jgi:hypothetical protein